jgi:hypothetical protein
MKKVLVVLNACYNSVNNIILSLNATFIIIQIKLILTSKPVSHHQLKHEVDTWKIGHRIGITPLSVIRDN